MVVSFFLFFSVKTACESQEYDLQGLLSLADSAANSIEKLVLDGGKIPEVSPGSPQSWSSLSSCLEALREEFCNVKWCCVTNK